MFAEFELVFETFSKMAPHSSHYRAKSTLRSYVAGFCAPYARRRRTSNPYLCRRAGTTNRATTRDWGATAPVPASSTLPHCRRGSRTAAEAKSAAVFSFFNQGMNLSLIHISEPTRLGMISYAVFCLKKKKQ